MIAAIISAFAAVCVAALTFYWTKRREREADWRKLKLEHYREYIIALSGIVGSRSTSEHQRRYADAVNSLALIAPPNVLKELYRFQDENSYRNSSRSSARLDEILDDLMNAIRADVDPTHSPSSTKISYRMFDVPPEPQAPEPAKT